MVWYSPQKNICKKLYWTLMVFIRHIPYRNIVTNSSPLLPNWDCCYIFHEVNFFQSSFFLYFLKLKIACRATEKGKLTAPILNSQNLTSTLFFELSNTNILPLPKFLSLVTWNILFLIIAVLAIYTYALLSTKLKVIYFYLIIIFGM